MFVVFGFGTGSNGWIMRLLFSIPIQSFSDIDISFSFSLLPCVGLVSNVDWHASISISLHRMNGGVIFPFTMQLLRPTHTNSFLFLSFWFGLGSSSFFFPPSLFAFVSLFHDSFPVPNLCFIVWVTRHYHFDSLAITFTSPPPSSHSYYPFSVVYAFIFPTIFAFGCVGTW